MPPLIAVTGAMLPEGRVPFWRHGAAAVPRSYVDALSRAGATSVVVTAAPAPDLARFDGLVLTGGGDVDPTRYGEQARTKLYAVDPARDELEIGMARAAVDEGRPLLAICRGMQVLNVALGGSLEQHIGERSGLLDHGQFGPTPVLREVAIEPGSRVAEAIGADRVTGSCHHHQAVARLGDGVRVTARAGDGVVEAFEVDGAPCVLAVQWHPEDTAGSDPVQQRLFDAFVARFG